MYDFFKKLKSNSKSLYVLGNGKQKKSYLHVYDCINAMLIAINKSKQKVNIFNLGTNEYCKVNDKVDFKIFGCITKAKILWGKAGWIERPFIFLDTKN